MNQLENISPVLRAKTPLFYYLFDEKETQIIKDNNPKKTRPEIVKQLCHQWNNLTEKEKEPWNQLHLDEAKRLSIPITITNRLAKERNFLTIANRLAKEQRDIPIAIRLSNLENSYLKLNSSMNELKATLQTTLSIN